MEVVYKKQIEMIVYDIHTRSDTILAFQKESSLKSKKPFGGIILKQALWVKYYYPQLGIVLCYH